MGVVDLKIVTQTGFKILRRVEIASFEKAPGQHAKPELDLVEPGAMFGRKMEHMLMARITQEGPPLRTPAQVLGHKEDLTPLRTRRQTSRLQWVLRLSTTQS